MVIVVEPVRHGVEHQPFNASLLLCCRAAFPGERVRFLAEPGHLAEVRSALGEEPGIDYTPITVAPRRAGDFARIAADGRVARLALDAAAAEGAPLLVFASVTTPLLWHLARLAKRAPATKIAGVLHGGLAASLRRPRFNFLKRLASLRTAIAAAAPRARLVVLEAPILDAVARAAPELAERLGVLPHPLPPDTLAAKHAERDLEAPVRIGLLGLCTPQKGLFTFLGLAERLHEELRGRAEFHIVGRIHEDHAARAAPQLRFLAGQPASAPLPREEFLRRVERLHYAAFFFEGAHYAAVASGVLLDCLALGIPLIGRRHPLLDGLASGAEPLGRFCARGEEESLIRSIALELPAETWREQRRNVLALRASRTPEALASYLRDL